MGLDSSVIRQTGLRRRGNSVGLDGFRKRSGTQGTLEPGLKEPTHPGQHGGRQSVVFRTEADAPQWRHSGATLVSDFQVIQARSPLADRGGRGSGSAASAQCRETRITRRRRWVRTHGRPSVVRPPRQAVNREANQPARSRPETRKYRSMAARDGVTSEVFCDVTKLTDGINVPTSLTVDHLHFDPGLRQTAIAGLNGDPRTIRIHAPFVEKSGLMYQLPPTSSCEILLKAGPFPRTS
jgi:hypothetical protein